MAVSVAAKFARNTSYRRDLLLGAFVGKGQAEMPSSVVGVENMAIEAGNGVTFERGTTSKQTTEFLLMLGREVRYEVLENVRVVQFEVLDASDGKVVRKVPTDEVIRFLELMKERIDGRVDILA